MSTMISVRPIVSETAEGYKLTGDGIKSPKEKMIVETGDPKGCIDMPMISQILAEAVNWEKSQTRSDQDGGSLRQTTTALNGNYTAGGYRYTVSLSVTRKKVSAKDDGFALMSDAEIDTAVANVENLLTLKVITTVQAQKALDRLPKKRGQ